MSPSPGEAHLPPRVRSSYTRPDMRPLSPGIASTATALVCALTALAAVPPTPPSPTPDVTRAVKDLDNVYRMTGFGADFEQTYVIKAYGVTKTSAGHVVFARPASVDWRYSTSPNDRVVSDGVTLSYYDAASQQVHRQPAGPSQYEVLALLPGKLASECNLTILPGGFPGGYILLCDPKTPNVAYTKILFYVEQPTSLVKRVLLLDGQGNRNRFDFDKIALNPPLLPQQFVIVPPPGAAVVGANQAASHAPPPPPSPSATAHP